MINLSDREYEQLVSSAAAAAAPRPTLTWGKAFAAAFAKAQGALQTATKDREVKVDSAKGGYTFKYATLAAVLEAARPALAENGLALLQEPEVEYRPGAQSYVHIDSTLLHSSGEYKASRFTLPTSRIDPQGVGAVISYARRYAAQSILGLASDDDKEEHLPAQPAPPRKPYTPPSPPPAGATSTEPSPPPELPDAWKPDERMEALAVRIREAQDSESLKALVPELRTLSETAKAALKKLYNARARELAEAVPS